MTYKVVTDKREISDAISALETQIANGSEQMVRSLGFPGPGAGFKDSTIYWHNEEKFWSYFRTVEKRHWCAYGTSIGNDKEELVPTVEINPPLEGVNRMVRGQILTDNTGGFFLAHKGGLGGGRGGSVKIHDFWTKFDHPNLSQAYWQEDGKASEFHVIGQIGSEKMMPNLGHFIYEAQRLRGLAKSGQ